MPFFLYFPLCRFPPHLSKYYLLKQDPFFPINGLNWINILRKFKGAYVFIILISNSKISNIDIFILKLDIEILNVFPTCFKVCQQFLNNMDTSRRVAVLNRTANDCFRTRKDSFLSRARSNGRHHLDQ